MPAVAARPRSGRGAASERLDRRATVRRSPHRSTAMSTAASLRLRHHSRKSGAKQCSPDGGSAISASWIGSYLPKARRSTHIRRNSAMTEFRLLFPELEPLVDRRAGLLSSGEQQMLARALCGRPKVLMVDEMSPELAPLICPRLSKILRYLATTTGLRLPLSSSTWHLLSSCRPSLPAQSRQRGDTGFEGRNPFSQSRTRVLLPRWCFGGEAGLICTRR